MTVCILGGGIIGLCSAWYAAERGFEVTVLERGPDGGDSCSLGNAGMIVPSHFVPLAAPGMMLYGLKQLANPESPFWIRPKPTKELVDWGLKFMKSATQAHVDRSAPLLRDLNNTSRAEYETLAETFGNEFGLVKRGLLMLTKTQHALDEETAMAAKARVLGIPAEVLTPEETAKLDPKITMEIAGSVYFPNDCHLSPSKLMAGLARRLKERGVRFVYGASVAGWVTTKGRVTAALTSAGQFEADQFVLAGGAWSPEAARGLSLSLPMQAGKGYSITLENPKQLPEICSIFVEARVAVTPMGGTLRVGGTMEIAGNDLSVNPRRVAGIVKSVPRYYPAFSETDFAGLPTWSGLRPVSPDGLPYLGRPAKWSNVVVATGHAMMGLSLGPVTGKLVGEVLAGVPPSIPLTLLSPDRFA
ncbi:FAD-dependent oxidoreductase [Armatimonas sp.]|uniref:NAD(P)/FAD-dependent oxidoreductase n=1 Tax=Armatimonas sp. TaxID=1872638 RepID=UPI00286C793C|nr:FAD-dependent oxidoreductase [Armatimonas sp.]